mgnify:CR=1 FL=1
MNYCCTDCQSDWLYGNGLGSLDLPPIQAGSSFSLGVELSGWDTLTDLSYWSKNGLLAAIKKAVESGGFVQIPIRLYFLTGVANWNPFLVIEGKAFYSHSSASHLRDAVLSAIGSVIDFDNGSVRFEADTYDLATGQPNTEPSKRRYDAPAGGGNTQALPKQPNEIDWPDWIDSLSNETGFGPWAILGVGAILITGGAVALKRLV